MIKRDLNMLTETEMKTELEKIQSLLGRMLMGEKIIIPSRYVPNRWGKYHTANILYYTNEIEKYEGKDMILTVWIDSHNKMLGLYQFDEIETKKIIDYKGIVDIIQRSVYNGWKIPDNHEHGKIVDIISQLI